MKKNNKSLKKELNTFDNLIKENSPQQDKPFKITWIIWEHYYSGKKLNQSQSQNWSENAKDVLQMNCLKELWFLYKNESHQKYFIPTKILTDPVNSVQ